MEGEMAFPKRFSPYHPHINHQRGERDRFETLSELYKKIKQSRTAGILMEDTRSVGEL